jgi:hypothetical protein
MLDKTVKRRLEDAGDASLASDDGPIFFTVAKLVEALEPSIPEGSQNTERKKEALRLRRARWCSAGRDTKKPGRRLTEMCSWVLLRFADLGD